MARSGRFRLLRRLRGELAAWRAVDGHLKELYRAVGDRTYSPGASSRWWTSRR
ncbi:MAG: hypothetical protein ACRDK9_08090 [Solirubrobacterales bacterium]